MAVIPNGQGSDKVIVWDKEEGNQNVVAPGSSPGPNPVNHFGGGWPQRFAVGDPETNTWQNYVLTIPLGSGGEHLGDLFCAGHTWLPDGRLFVAGGNEVYGNTGLPASPLPLTPGIGGAQTGQHTVLPGLYYGSRIAAIWDPNLPRTAVYNYGWTFLQPMKVRRWYPSVTLLGNNTVIVSGGSETAPHLASEAAFNSHEVYNLANGTWNTYLPATTPAWPGPTLGSQIGNYPRQHLLTNNRLFMVGMGDNYNRLWHDINLMPPVLNSWDTNPTTGVPPLLPVYSVVRSLGASVLLPQIGISGNTNTVMVMGGESSGVAWRSTHFLNGTAPTPAYVAGPLMQYARHCLNAVVMPSGEVIAIGGAYDGFTMNTPTHVSEIYNSSSGWRLDDAQGSPRGYHSTAALLPSGRIVSAGSDIGVRTSDYEVYTPSCMTPPAGTGRPEFAGALASAALTGWAFGGTFPVDYVSMDPREWIRGVVLMRPCSTTHHSDFDQRYVELDVVPPPPSEAPITVQGQDRLWVQIPPAPVTSATINQVSALPGFYIMFLVSNLGYVSEGRWVRLQ